MESVNIAQEIASLPPEAQKQILDFVAFLKTRYAAAQGTTKKSPAELADDPFIGMWQGRQDMQDSVAWVRRLRQRDYRFIDELQLLPYP